MITIPTSFCSGVHCRVSKISHERNAPICFLARDGMERPRLPNEAFDELNGDGAPSGAHREVSNADGAR